MKRLDNLTIKASWLAVIGAFTGLLVVVGGLGGYSIHHNEKMLDAIKTVSGDSGSVRNNQLTNLGLDPEISKTFIRYKASQRQALYDAFDHHAFVLKIAILVTVLSSIVVILVVVSGIRANVLKPLDRIVGHMEHMADGDLSADVERRGSNEIGRLFKGILDMQNGLAETVGQVRQSSRAIHDGAARIARGNGELSRRTETQAASLEETAASMEQLNTTVSRNADNAQQASDLARSGSETAEHGGTAVKEVVDSMHEINNSSQKVVDNIDVIDSIAFQTNILAINASVEAARAGQQGRGFAVVASEVRTLASRSADAAREIRQVIEDSAERINAGSQRAEQAGATMNEVVNSVHKVNQLVDEIATASNEQSNGIGEVNTAVNEMDSVTQQNASMVQDAASAANELENEAALMQDAVSVFHLAAADAPAKPHQASVTPEAAADTPALTAPPVPAPA
ncbi:methyl-accepting chemotaxis protein [Salinisphaera orenii]|uniref:methyl-accepting chemotaxis protein n=1 Tax=Salinisphaera orenii TaxID=856731 RepID=UPI0013A61879